MPRTTILLLAMCISFSILASAAFAGVGVSPIEITYNNVVRGGYAESYITVSNPGSEAQVVTIGVEGQSGKWSVAEPNNFTLEGHGYKIVRMLIQPPTDVPNGVYESTIYVNSVDVQTAAAISQGIGVAVTSGVGIMQYVNIVGTETRNYIVEGISIPSTEECRPVQFIANVRNSGNVRLTSKIGIDVFSESGEYLRTYNYTSEQMLPTKLYTFIIRMPPDFGGFTCMPVGNYNAKLTAFLDGNTVFTTEKSFNVVERGTLTITGMLQEIAVQDKATLGETVKIDGTFKNTGQLPVLAKLKAEIYSGDKLSTAVEGDEIEVNLGESKTLTAYWQPGWIGDYKVKASVLYEGRKTDAKEADVKVELAQTMIYAIAGAIVVIAVIVLALMLRGMRKSGRK